MAETPVATQDQQSLPNPRTVLAAKSVDLVLITYTDDASTLFTQLAIVGDNSVHLIEGKEIGLSKYTTPQGRANEWLAEGVFKKLGRQRKTPSPLKGE